MAKRGVVTTGPVYRYRPGAHNMNVPAQIVGETLARLTDEHGSLLKPKHVIAEARAASSPLHALFEWDDRIAGERFRENQARTVIRAIVIVETDRNTGQAITLPVYVHIPQSKTGPHYRTVGEAMARPEEWTLAIQALLTKREALERSLLDLRRMADEAGAADRAATLTVAIEALSACKIALQQAAVH